MRVLEYSSVSVIKEKLMVSMKDSVIQGRDGNTYKYNRQLRETLPVSAIAFDAYTLTINWPRAYCDSQMRRND